VASPWRRREHYIAIPPGWQSNFRGITVANVSPAIDCSRRDSGQTSPLGKRRQEIALPPSARLAPMPRESREPLQFIDPGVVQRLAARRPPREFHDLGTPECRCANARVAMRDLICRVISVVFHACYMAFVGHKFPLVANV
jgi:hypothetical protein